MYRITSGIHIHFAHHVRGHEGPCISLHGHTWLFKVTLQAAKLDKSGFVVDFDVLHEKVLTRCHRLLDHALAVGETTWLENKEALTQLGTQLVRSRRETLGHLGQPQPSLAGDLCGARNERPGGIKVAVFPFTPTSERLAEWLYNVTQENIADDRVSVFQAHVMETLHPVESLAEYQPSPGHPPSD